MFTFSLVQKLLDLPKKVEQNGVLCDHLPLVQRFPFRHNFVLVSPDDPDYTFLYEVWQSAKNQFKMTLYLMDDDTRTGLLRVDYSGQHKNPETITESVPAIFHPYVGRFFDYHEHHIHYFVEGYKTTLYWALPLASTYFAVKTIASASDVVLAFLEFNRVIRLETIFTTDPLLL